MLTALLMVFQSQRSSPVMSDMVLLFHLTRCPLGSSGSEPASNCACKVVKEGPGVSSAVIVETHHAMLSPKKSGGSVVKGKICILDSGPSFTFALGPHPGQLTSLTTCPIAISAISLGRRQLIDRASFIPTSARQMSLGPVTAGMFCFYCSGCKR